MVELSGLCVGYGERPVLQGVSLNFPPGQVTILLGPNGCGKSTLLKAALGLIPVKEGAVRYDGQDIRSLSPKEIARRAAYLAQSRGVPNITAKRMVLHGRFPYLSYPRRYRPEDYEKAREALAWADALDLADRPMGQISGGQRQKVYLAMALAQDTQTIFMDEPTAYLDIRHKLELLGILKRMVRERKLTVVMSLHELDLAQKVSDSVICVKGDRIAKYGKPEEIFTADYIHELYDMSAGSYNEAFGSLELEPPEGPAETFVIAGGGSGIPIYRRLQRKGIPFYTGVLHKNDVDYQVAKVLARETVAEEAFEPISEKQYAHALENMMKCRTVIAAVKEFGTMNEKNRILLEEAQKAGMEILDGDREYWEKGSKGK